jgi:hypothetical protein
MYRGFHPPPKTTAKPVSRNVLTEKARNDLSDEKPTGMSTSMTASVEEEVHVMDTNVFLFNMEKLSGGWHKYIMFLFVMFVSFVACSHLVQTTKSWTFSDYATGYRTHHSIRQFSTGTSCCPFTVVWFTQDHLLTLRDGMVSAVEIGTMLLGIFLSNSLVRYQYALVLHVDYAVGKLQCTLNTNREITDFVTGTLNNPARLISVTSIFTVLLVAIRHLGANIPANALAIPLGLVAIFNVACQDRFKNWIVLAFFYVLEAGCLLAMMETMYARTFSKRFDYGFFYKFQYTSGNLHLLEDAKGALVVFYCAITVGLLWKFMVLHNSIHPRHVTLTREAFETCSVLGGDTHDTDDAGVVTRQPVFITAITSVEPIRYRIGCLMLVGLLTGVLGYHHFFYSVVNRFDICGDEYWCDFLGMNDKSHGIHQSGSQNARIEKCTTSMLVVWNKNTAYHNETVAQSLMPFQGSFGPHSTIGQWSGLMGPMNSQWATGALEEYHRTKKIPRRTLFFMLVTISKRDQFCNSETGINCTELALCLGMPHTYIPPNLFSWEHLLLRFSLDQNSNAFQTHHLANFNGTASITGSLSHWGGTWTKTMLVSAAVRTTMGYLVGYTAMSPYGPFFARLEVWVFNNLEFHSCMAASGRDIWNYIVSCSFFPAAVAILPNGHVNNPVNAGPIIDGFWQMAALFGVG